MKVLLDTFLKAPPDKEWINTRRGLCSSKKEVDSWHHFTYGEIKTMVLRLAAWLKEEQNIKPGQIIGLLSENRIDLVICVLATHACSAIACPLFPNYSASQVQYAVDSFKIDLLFISNRLQEQKVLNSVRKMVFESPDFRDIVANYKILESGDFIIPDEMSPGFIIPTSGTTGEPKGVILPHYGIYRASERMIEFGCETKWERSLSFLPLCHVAGLQDLYTSVVGGGKLWMIESKEELLTSFKDSKPTHFLCVPNLFEKVKNNIEVQVRNESILKQYLFKVALRLGHRRYTKKITFFERLFLPLFEALVFKKIKAIFGGEIEAFGAGAAPLSKELYDFYWSVGMPLKEGYGFTESSGLIAGNSLHATREGTVGRPSYDASIKIAEDGEILIKDKALALGYVNAPFELTPDGFFATGDLGEFTEEGYLRIIGRKKELIVLNTGEKVSPLQVEIAIKRSPLIEEAVAVGDGCKFLSIAIVVSEGEKIDDLKGEIEKYSEELATFEKPKKYFVIPEMPEEVLTPTMKVKRSIFEKYFKEHIDRLYT